MATELKNISLSNEVAITQYDVSVIPNDFNINTINNLIESGGIEMPFFQRNYVWDKKRASKFIESLVLGLPIPQIFLYQKERNKFLVIDGQQRLLTIYYFIKERFPKKTKRVALRKIFDEHGCIPNSIFSNDEYFEDFKLQLESIGTSTKHPLNGLKFNTLDDYQANFSFTTIRCMTIRQNAPTDDDSSIFEIFNRLNTGGMNLGSQEIRACLYYSNFYRMLSILNQKDEWRRIYGKKEEDAKSKDIEVLLRAFALLVYHDNYGGSMNAFINRFAKETMKYSEDEINYFKNLFDSFLQKCSGVDAKAFSTKNGQFNVALFDGVFVAISEEAYKNKRFINIGLSPSKMSALKDDKEFEDAITHSTSHTNAVRLRVEKAREYLL